MIAKITVPWDENLRPFLESLFVCAFRVESFDVYPGYAVLDGPVETEEIQINLVPLEGADQESVKSNDS